MDCKEIHPVHPTGNQTWIFTGRTDAEAETPILWPPDAKNWLIWIDPDAGKDWGQEKKGTTEDEMVGWHHRFNGHGFGWTLGVGDGQGGLTYCSSSGHKESDRTEQLNWTEQKQSQILPFGKGKKTRLNYIYQVLKVKGLNELVIIFSPEVIMTYVWHYWIKKNALS